MNETGPAKTILIVDDEEHIRRLLQRILKPEGYRLLAAADGAEALTIAAAQPLDLVLLDRSMPRMDGLTVVRRLRETPQGRLLPVIMVTGLADGEDEVEALDTGADGYISKPFDSEDLRTRVAAMLKGGDR